MLEKDCLYVCCILYILLPYSKNKIYFIHICDIYHHSLH